MRGKSLIQYYCNLDVYNPFMSFLAARSCRDTQDRSGRNMSSGSTAPLCCVIGDMKEEHGGEVRAQSS